MNTPATMPRELVLLDQACTFLAESSDLNEIKKVHDKAEALRLYAKKQGGQLHAQNIAAAAKLKTERLMGKISKQLDKKQGKRTDKLVDTPSASSKKEALEAAGISQKAASRYETIDDVPEEEFEKTISKAIESGRELTTKQFYKLGRSHQKAEDRRQRIASAPEIGGNIHTGDMSLLFDLVADDSADLFFTDPPYHEDKTDLFGRLAELAQRKLKPGGLCICYSGQMFLPIVMDEMRKHLDYYWQFALHHTGGGSNQIWTRRFMNHWKPVLVFAKRPVTDPIHEWVSDFREGGGRDKRYHPWGQDATEASLWIEKLCPPGGLVVDPFAGGGTIPAACKATGRRWIATEENPEDAAIARSRVA
jgi:hypothetical protein